MVSLYPVRGEPVEPYLRELITSSRRQTKNPSQPRDGSTPTNREWMPAVPPKFPEHVGALVQGVRSHTPALANGGRIRQSLLGEILSVRGSGGMFRGCPSVCSHHRPRPVRRRQTRCCSTVPRTLLRRCLAYAACGLRLASRITRVKDGQFIRYTKDALSRLYRYSQIRVDGQLDWFLLEKSR